MPEYFIDMKYSIQAKFITFERFAEETIPLTNCMEHRRKLGKGTQSNSRVI
jgi:hypothetical protein